ncbi:hypothetical protein OIU76_001793 [Salix suchowensis]|uniref:Uncharacterized protein n=1 Tax=Salix suchowensis TaxID=1278906 RepID=A0ABQ9CKZ1_9ROSI|nr:hypothetical protein OIU76_001793 [Salix suchowensis]KAJ6399055.1 hypothetical protein OIU77_019744 [Salix suchowensis]
MMGSFGEEELDEMVRDYIESDQSITPVSLMRTSKPLPRKSQSSLQDIILEVKDVETRVLDRVLMYVRGMGEPNSLKKWVVMRLQRDGYEASLCKTSWVSTFGRKKVFQFSGDYEYIDVMIMDKNISNEATRLILDMDFRSQFELARPTQTYKELMNTIPSIFLGTEERLDKIISLLCSAAEESFKEKGLHIPPWRKAMYMQSKWLSENCKKVPVIPNPGLVDLGASEAGKSTACCSSIF